MLKDNKANKAYHQNYYQKHGGAEVQERREAREKLRQERQERLMIAMIEKEKLRDTSTLLSAKYDKTRGERYRNAHPEKLREKARRLRLDPSGKRKETEWKRKGIVFSYAEYQAMLEKQCGLCAICRTPHHRALCVDHDHRTGKVRGLLCQDCNLGLGKLKDEILVLESAINYLKTY